MSEGNLIGEDRDRSGRDNGRRQASNGTFAIKVGNDALEFRDLDLIDPVPTGRQIIKAAGFGPVDEFLIFAVSHDHRLTEVKLDETVDIRGLNEESFLIFRNDRSWRGVINGNRFEWGACVISGHVLKWLVCVDPATHSVWLELRDEPDRLINDDEQVSLSPAGLERFRTEPLIRVCLEDEFHPWPRPTITTEEIAALGGWDISLGVIEVDSDQNERTLSPDETIKLRPGVSFGKKLRFKRG